MFIEHNDDIQLNNNSVKYNDSDLSKVIHENHHYQLCSFINNCNDQFIDIEE